MLCTHPASCDTLQVYALLDAHGQGAPTVITVAQGLSQPSSVAWCNGSLFVAEPTRLLRLDGIDEYVLTGKVSARLRQPLSTLRLQGVCAGSLSFELSVAFAMGTPMPEGLGQAAKGCSCTLRADEHCASGAGSP